MTSKPLVSVVIPAHNAAAYVGQAVESALAQTFTDLEVIVVDDGSTDNTAEVLALYSERIRVVRQNNRGRSAARNVAIRQARGEYLAFLDADDVWLPHKLERQVPALDQQPEVVLVYSVASVVDGNGRERRLGDRVRMVGQGEPQAARIVPRLIWGNCVVCSTALARRREVQWVGLFDERLAYPEDWDLWLRLGHVGPVVFVPEPLARYRVESEARAAALAASTEIVEQCLYVVEKAFSQSSELCPESKGPAVAQVYVRAALAAFVLGAAKQGSEYLELAVRADGDLPSQVRTLVARALDRSRIVAAETGAEEGRAYLERFLASLPRAFGPVGALRRSVLGDYYMSAFFESHASGDSGAVRQALWPGLRYAPRWLANRGVWRIAWNAWRPAAH